MDEDLLDVKINYYRETVVDFETAYRIAMRGKNKCDYDLCSAEYDVVKAAKNASPVIRSLRNLYRCLTLMKDNSFHKKFQDELKWCIQTLQTENGRLNFNDVLKKAIIAATDEN